MNDVLKPGAGVGADGYGVLSLRDRAEVQNRWLKIRLDQIVEELMEREGFDMWILVAREGNEDPVVMTMLPHPVMAARRRTVLVFSRTGDGLERFVLARYPIPGYYDNVWDADNDDVWQTVADLVSKRDPDTIGVNVSDTYALADGLSYNEHEHLMRALGDYRNRVKRGERLAVGWLERRIPEELDAYPRVVEIAHAIIAEAFSSRVVHPGITTTNDVVWWMREKMKSVGVGAWFQPSVMLQAPGIGPKFPGFPEGDRRELIMPGDVLHCDVGISYLGLETDSQQHAYVLRRGEEVAPEGLRAALRSGNRIQDIIMEEFRVGRKGNEILRICKERAAKEKIKATFYTHPIGFHGHGAGPGVGMWDNQEFLPGLGEYELFEDTCFAVEFNVKQAVPEWDGQEVMIGLEQDIVFTGGRCYFMAGRQTEFYLVG